MLRDDWETNAQDWISWARAPGFDHYWRYHRDAFLSLVPPPGRLTIDLGCGEGRLGRDLVRLGHRLIEVDSSKTMTRANASHPEASGRILLCDAGSLPLPDEVADCVVAFMSLQDIDQMESAVAECARLLVSGGHLVLAVTHPLNSAGEFGEGTEEQTRPFVIEGSWFDRKALSRTVERDGHSMTFNSEHRSLQDYVDALAEAGLLIERIREVGDPSPDDKWHRIPLFIHIRAVSR